MKTGSALAADATRAVALRQQHAGKEWLCTAGAVVMLDFCLSLLNASRTLQVA